MNNQDQALKELIKGLLIYSGLGAIIGLSIGIIYSCLFYWEVVVSLFSK